MGSVTPANLPRYSRRQIRLFNLLATRRPEITLDLDGTQATFVLRPIDGLSGPVARLGLEAPGARLWLELGVTALERLCAPWIGHGSLEALPAPLRDAALIAGISPLLAGLRNVFGFNADLARGEEPPPADALCLGLEPAESPPGSSPAAVMRLSEPAAEALAAKLETFAPKSYRTNWLDVPVDLRLTYGETRLPAGDLRTIEPGDVLLMPPGSAAEPKLLLCQPYRRLAAGRLEGRKLLIDRLLENTMTENEQANAGDAPTPGLDPDQLEIRLEFDLGHLTLSLRELRQIRPGYSFELDVPASGSVRILAGSKTIGRGDLVQIEDRLGVRVTELFRQADE